MKIGHVIISFHSISFIFLGYTRYLFIFANFTNCRKTVLTRSKIYQGMNGGNDFK
ncbi:hypothetical protein GIB67_018801, partial [Kingdonia uniflora]